jgi:hypothetical protein
VFGWMFGRKGTGSRDASGKPTRYEYQIFADYHQFYVQDDNEKVGDLSAAWDRDATDRLLAVAPYAIGVGTVRNTTVPVTIEVLQAKPDVVLDEWEQVNLCSLKCQTGRLVLAGCTDYFPDAARIKTGRGTYRALVCYKGLGTLSPDGLEGDDRYHVFLYPGQECEVSVLKRR